MLNLAWLYTGVVYGAGVWLARRGGVEIPRRIALLFYALVLAFLFEPLALDRPNIHADFLKTLAPWTYVSPDTRVVNRELNDVPLQQVPWAHQVRRRWKSLQLPLWNHENGSGYPLLANGQSSALSPIRLAALPLPLVQAMAAEGAFKLLIAVTFTFLFCRGRGCSQAASVTGAIVFGLSGYLNTWLHFPHATAACFLPAVLYLVDRLAEGFNPARFVAAAAVWASIVFAGHPETASHIFLLALAYTIWVVAVERRTSWRLLLTLGGALTVAALLSTPFLLPFLEALPRSHRYLSLRAAPHDPSRLAFSDLESMVATLQPRFFGRVPGEEPWGPAVTETVCGFPGALGLLSGFAVAVHVIWRRRWRSAEAFFPLATLLAFAVISSWPVLSDLVHGVLPVVAHARVRLLFVMLLAVQAAMATDAAAKGDGRPLLAGAATAAALLVGLFLWFRFPEAKLRDAAMLAAVPSAAVAAAAALFAWRPRRALLGLLLLAVIAEMAPLMRGWNPALPKDLVYPTTPVIRNLQWLAARQPLNVPFRILGTHAAVFPNTGVLYGFEDVRVHDPMANGRYVDFLSYTASLDPWEYHARLNDPNVPVFDFLNVRYLITQPGTIAWPSEEHWRGLYEGPDGRIFENRRFLPRFFAVRNVVAEADIQSLHRRLASHQDWAETAYVDGTLRPENARMRADFFDPRPAGSPAAVAKILEAEPTEYRVHVRAPRWSLVVSSIPWWPGWKVERAGVEVAPIRVNGAFLGFAAPPGEVDVRVWYDPWTFRFGAIVALATIAGMGLFVLNAHRRPAGEPM